MDLATLRSILDRFGEEASGIDEYHHNPGNTGLDLIWARLVTVRKGCKVLQDVCARASIGAERMQLVYQAVNSSKDVVNLLRQVLGENASKIARSSRQEVPINTEHSRRPRFLESLRRAMRECRDFLGSPIVSVASTSIPLDTIIGLVASLRADLGDNIDILRSSLPDTLDFRDISVELFAACEARLRDDLDRILSSLLLLQAKDDNYGDSDTESTVAESILSLQSIASSFTSLGAGPVAEEVVYHLVDCFRDTPGFSSLCAHALRDPDLGQPKLSRNLRRLISALGAALKSEKNGDRRIRYVARSVQSRSISTQVTNQVVGRIEVPVARPDGESYEGDAHYESDDSLEPIDSDGLDSEPEDVGPSSTSTTDRYSGLREGIRNSQAFASFRMHLLEFVHQPYATRIAKTLKVLSTRYKALIDELTWVPPSRIRICTQEQISLGDHLKTIAERMTGRAWGWWPLRPPKRAIREGFHRVKWKTVSFELHLCLRNITADRQKPNGFPRSINITIQNAEALKRVLATAPEFLEINEPFLESTLFPRTLRAAKQASGSQGVTRTNVPPGGSAPSGLHGQPSSTGSPSGSHPLPQPPQTNQYGFTALPPINAAHFTPPEVHYLYVCSPKSTRRFRYFHLENHELQSDQLFFASLKQHYLESRNFATRWLSWASWWQYDHCAFWQVSSFSLSPNIRSNSRTANNTTSSSNNSSANSPSTATPRASPSPTQPTRTTPLLRDPSPPPRPRARSPNSNSTSNSTGPTTMTTINGRTAGPGCNAAGTPHTSAASALAAAAAVPIATRSSPSRNGAPPSRSATAAARSSGACGCGSAGRISSCCCTCSRSTSRVWCSSSSGCLRGTTRRICRMRRCRR